MMIIICHVKFWGPQFLFNTHEFQSSQLQCMYFEIFHTLGSSYLYKRMKNHESVALDLTFWQWNHMIVGSPVEDLAWIWNHEALLSDPLQTKMHMATVVSTQELLNQKWWTNQSLFSHWFLNNWQAAFTLAPFPTIFLTIAFVQVLHLGASAQSVKNRLLVYTCSINLLLQILSAFRVSDPCLVELTLSIPWILPARKLQCAVLGVYIVQSRVHLSCGLVSSKTVNSIPPFPTAKLQYLHVYW